MQAHLSLKHYANFYWNWIINSQTAFYLYFFLFTDAGIRSSYLEWSDKKYHFFFFFPVLFAQVGISHARALAGLCEVASWPSRAWWDGKRKYARGETSQQCCTVPLCSLGCITSTLTRVRARIRKYLIWKRCTWAVTLNGTRLPSPRGRPGFRFPRTFSLHLRQMRGIYSVQFSRLHLIVSAQLVVM